MIDGFTTYDPGCIPKDIWASYMASARALAITESNIRVGWRETGIYPFSPNRVLDRLQKVPTSSSTPSRSPLAPRAMNNLEFLDPWTPSPMKECVKSIITDVRADREDNEGLRARNAVLELDNKGLVDAMTSRKRIRSVLPSKILVRIS